MAFNTVNLPVNEFSQLNTPFAQCKAIYPSLRPINELMGKWFSILQSEVNVYLQVFPL